MRRLAGRVALVGITVLALGLSTLGPCLCLLHADACHLAADAPNAHTCCETPTGVQAVADECCKDGVDLVVVSTEVPELGPPVLQASPGGPLRVGVEMTPVVGVSAWPPLASLDRTTVLLI